MKQTTEPRRRTGRPLSFDRERALRAAMLAFWRHGYETTSIADLKAAMGVTAPSIYAAFGDKKRLFLEAVALYRGDVDAEAAAIRDTPSAKDAASALLAGAVGRFTGADTPPGCLMASATASGPATSSDVQAHVVAIRREIEDHLRRRVERDVADGALPADTDATALAATVVATIQGLSVLARDGRSRRTLETVASTVLRAWPEG